LKHAVSSDLFAASPLCCPLIAIFSGFNGGLKKSPGDRTMRRKQTHCLFIEEESYNWSAPKSAKHYRLIAVSVLVIVAGLLFSLLR
jgi:hypothetical protein